MNPLYRGNRMQMNNPVANMNNMLQQFNQFKNMLQGNNPQQIVQGLVNSGRITPEQLEQYKQTAAQLQRFLR